MGRIILHTHSTRLQEGYLRSGNVCLISCPSHHRHLRLLQPEIANIVRPSLLGVTRPASTLELSASGLLRDVRVVDARHVPDPGLVVDEDRARVAHQLRPGYPELIQNREHRAAVWGMEGMQVGSRITELCGGGVVLLREGKDVVDHGFVPVVSRKRHREIRVHVLRGRDEMGEPEQIICRGRRAGQQVLSRRLA